MLADAIVSEGELALDRARAMEAREEAAVLAKNEQLRANLLRSISHDLRTPLTSISGNADVLLDQGSTGTAVLDAQTRRGLLLSIRSDAQWLLSLIHISQGASGDCASRGEPGARGALLPRRCRDYGCSGGRDGCDVPSVRPRGGRARGGYLHPQAHESLYGRDEPIHGMVVQKLAWKMTNVTKGQFLCRIPYRGGGLKAV